MRFTIKLKLALTFGFIIMMTCGMAMLAISNLSGLNQAITDIIDGPAVNLRNSSDLSDTVYLSIRAEKNAILNTDPAQISGYFKEVADARAKITDILANLDKDQVPEIKQRVAEFRSTLPQWLALQDEILALARKTRPNPTLALASSPWARVPKSPPRFWLRLAS